MPNWVHNRIRCHRDNWPALKAALLDLSGEEGRPEVNFERIIPMPDYIYRSTLERGQWNDPNSWYMWSIENWGTKWNAADTTVDEQHCEIRFDTAWSDPEPVISALAVKLGFPLHVLFSDEDVVSPGAMGAYRIHRDTVTEIVFSEQRNIASHIRHDQPYVQCYSEYLTDADRRQPELAESFDVWEHLDLTFQEAVAS